MYFSSICQGSWCRKPAASLDNSSVSTFPVTMSFLGIDVGTTGCKASVFSSDGESLAFAYDEYDMVKPRPGWLELDPVDVWARVKKTIATAVKAAAQNPRGTAAQDHVVALAVSSMG